jgi:hypothetical protein
MTGERKMLKGANTMIVLKFLDPNGEVGFTEASNYHDAVKMTKVYKQDGYKLLDHYRMAEEI